MTAPAPNFDPFPELGERNVSGRCGWAGVCANPQDWHIIWTIAAPVLNSFACDLDFIAARTSWVYVAAHPPIPGICGVPGSRFDDTRNECFWLAEPTDVDATEDHSARP